MQLTQVAVKADDGTALLDHDGRAVKQPILRFHCLVRPTEHRLLLRACAVSASSPAASARVRGTHAPTALCVTASAPCLRRRPQRARLHTALLEGKRTPARCAGASGGGALQGMAHSTTQELPVGKPYTATQIDDLLATLDLLGIMDWYVDLLPQVRRAPLAATCCFRHGSPVVLKIGSAATGRVTLCVALKQAASPVAQPCQHGQRQSCGLNRHRHPLCRGHGRRLAARRLRVCVRPGDGPGARASGT